MAKLYNLAKMTVSGTPGTGTITLGAAATINGVLYLSFAAAGVSDGDIVDYSILDNGGSEIGTGTYTASGTTLTRTVTKSTNSNTAINASSASIVSISPRAETLNDVSLFTTGPWTPYTPTVTSGTGTFTTVSATGRSRTSGKAIDVEMEVTITNAGTAASYMQVTLPTAAASNKYVGVAFESASTGKSGGAVILPAVSTSAVLVRDASGATMIATGAIIPISIRYELP